jgi:hypothetical protein
MKGVVYEVNSGVEQASSLKAEQEDLSNNMCGICGMHGSTWTGFLFVFFGLPLSASLHGGCPCSHIT